MVFHSRLREEKSRRGSQGHPASSQQAQACVGSEDVLSWKIFQNLHAEKLELNFVLSSWVKGAKFCQHFLDVSPCKPNSLDLMHTLTGLFVLHVIRFAIYISGLLGYLKFVMFTK